MSRLQRHDEVEEAVADFESKTVMLRAERGDEVVVHEHGTYTVARRRETYYGPSLLLYDEQNARNLKLTAPGPGSHLQLWEPRRPEADKGRNGWVRGPMVTAELGVMKQYDICARCGEPLKTVEHQRESAIGVCER